MSFLHTSFTRRRALTVAATAVTVALAAAGCGDGGSAPTLPGNAGGEKVAQSVFDAAPVASDAEIPAGSTMDMIRKRGYLNVGGSLDAPLLSQQNPVTGQIEGFDADMAKLLAKYIIGKPEVKTVTIGTQTREAMLQAKSVDVIFQTYTITPQRATQVAFAGPYLTSGLAVAVRKDETGIKGVQDLAGKTVIVGANTPAVTALPSAAPGSKQVAFATDPQAVQALLQKRGDAYVQDFTLLASGAKANPGMKVVGEPFTTEAYGIGLNREDAQFKEFVNNWLKKIQADGTWAKVWESTLGSVVEGGTPTPPAIGSVEGS
ncbi:glutamate ABC transporter substrate-binding protein [Micromonospora sp. C28SCA-DRY-2]|uniref:glutamate ABC transporter substrate-binding protein n=1 Tax=Micromonospora sp. C28SCA-DRY-2 TaxID=3059522 RepID=UPI0026755A84|nr:glutamate ABC transporter substrate-binding protein [Micromonospora sp. C28SCA-DRY-2]MDO3700759.1 glutamate ABC transporter substrate-binding protein [Micromonospora sp. C28SCA-DRY-2]